MTESLVVQNLGEYLEDPDIETIIFKDEQHFSSNIEETESSGPPIFVVYANEQDALEFEQTNNSITRKPRNPLFCKICNEAFKSAIMLDQHLFYQHGENECKICQKSFLDLKKFKIHSNKCAAMKTLMCSYCGEGFQYEKTLEEHVVRRHEQDKKIPCTICGKFFADGKDMKNHLFR